MFSQCPVHTQTDGPVSFLVPVYVFGRQKCHKQVAILSFLLLSITSNCLWFLGALTCGRGFDLSWVDDSKLLSSTCCSNSPPNISYIQPTPLILSPNDLRDNHSALYIQYECTEKKCDSQEGEVVEIVMPTQRHSHDFQLGGGGGGLQPGPFK